MEIEEEDLDTYSLTDKGKKLLRNFDKEYLKSWKAGHDEQESQEIALKKVNTDMLEVALMRFISILEKEYE
jgi:DNA-binding PadR family transcriptional regulator